MRPTKEDFTKVINVLLSVAQDYGENEKIILSKDLHSFVGGYPTKKGHPYHKIPTCCSAMKGCMQEGDEILSIPPSGNGAKLLIKYKLPRTI